MLVNDDIHALSAAVSGLVAVPDSPGFAEEVFAFNAATVHRPDVVLGAADAQDIVAGSEVGGGAPASGVRPVHRPRRGIPRSTAACSSLLGGCRSCRSIRSNGRPGWEPA